MRVLQHYPPPWTERAGIVSDGNGRMVIDDMHLAWREEEDMDRLQRLILSTPRLLDVLKRCPVFLGDGTVLSVCHPTKSRDEMLTEWLLEVNSLEREIETGKKS